MKLSTYEDWKHCITVLCGIPLTIAYVKARLADLRDPQHHETRRFVGSWGEVHRSRVVREKRTRTRRRGIARRISKLLSGSRQERGTTACENGPFRAHSR